MAQHLLQLAVPSIAGTAQGSVLFALVQVVLL